MKRLHHMIYIVASLAFVAALAGCGGSSSSSQTGSLQLKVKWPDRSRLIPLAANSINATLFQGEGGDPIGHQLLARPAGNATETTVNFDNVPAGSVTLHADAFPVADGSGIMQAGGSSTVTVVAGQTAQVTVTMGSTIARVAITPASPTVTVGSTVQLTMTAFNQADEIVLTTPSKITWGSGTTVNATVNGTGNVSGIAVGTSLITATETESGRSGTTTVTVANSGGGGGSLSGKIVFRSDGGFFSMNPDGTNVTHIPNTSNSDNDVDVSPNGSKIVFWRQEANHFIYTMNADGTNLVKLTNVSDNEPVWSPDGTKIAFLRLFNGNGDVMVMNADGSNVTNLTNSPNTADDEPSWSPDGTKIVFVNGSTDNIRIMNADGSNNISLGTAGRNPSWSPDGLKIAFHKLGGNFRIFVINADGSNEVQISSQDDSQADWSPDGAKIVFASNRNGPPDIYVMNADGSNQVRLTNNAIDDYSPKWR